MATAGTLAAVLCARSSRRHDTPNVAVTVVTAVTLAVAVGALAARVAPIDIFDNCGTLSSFGFMLVYMLIAVAAALYSRRLGSTSVVDLGVSVAALALLVLAAIWLFDSVPAPPQRWFGYYFLGFLAVGWLLRYRARFTARRASK